MIDVEHYRTRLQELEAAAIARTERAREAATTATSVDADDVKDSGDAGLTHELVDESLAQAAWGADTLAQIRAALTRIDNGTYGQCVVDGEPIEKARLDALPWAPFCLKHAEDAESGDPERMPTV